MSKVPAWIVATTWVVFLVVLPCPEAQAQGKPPAKLNKQIDEHIRHLIDDGFDVRAAAEKALVKIGKPALLPCYKAYLDSKDPELRIRARLVMRKIDPDFFRP